MADKIVKRGISVYIDGSKVVNSLKGMRNELRTLINEQAKMTVGSDEYVKHAKKIGQLKSIIEGHTRAQKEVEKQYAKMSDAADKYNEKKEKAFSLSNLADGFNKYFGMFTSFIAALTGITLGARKAVDEFAELEESEADVMKYTGMTKEEVKDLGEEFKKWDTRTARIELNALAADAGRLGKTSKKDLLDFAEAGNIIKVSLGEDLGEDAIKNIGKLSMMFGNADTMGLKEAMLATGSAINEVAQNSSASEPYLVNFTNRLAGIGKQAGMSISQIIGLGSVLDQNAQQVEMSSTALSGLMMKLYKEPAKFAQIAGLEVKSFTKLLREDANEALLTLLETLGKKGGMADLAPVFEEMKLDGARASSVLAVLAGNIASIRKEQETATNAFSVGTSVVDEYNVKNNTLQATIDKAKKKFQEYVYELGEKLAPHMKNFITTGGSMVKIISAITGFLINHGKQLLVVTSAIAAYTIALKTLTILEKARNIRSAITLLIQQAKEWYAMGKALGFATANQIAFNSALLLNPYVWAITAITGLITALTLYARKSREAVSSTKALADAKKSLNPELAKEQAYINDLFNAYRKTNPESEEHRKIRDKIIEKYGPYLQGLIDEKGEITDIGKALQIVNDKLRQQIALKIRNTATEKIMESTLKNQTDIVDDIMKKVDKQVPGKETSNLVRKKINELITSFADGADYNIDELRVRLSNSLSEFGVNVYEGGGIFGRNIDSFISELSTKIKEGNKELNEVKSQYEGLIDEMTEVQNLTNDGSNNKNNNNTPSGGNNLKENEQRQKLNDELKKLETEHLAETTKIKQQYINGEIKTEYDYNVALLNQQDKFDQERKDKLNELLKNNTLSETSVRIDANKKIAEIDEKNLQRQISQVNKLKKILMDADPIESEKQAYQNRLRELGLFDVKEENLTTEQKETLQLLEEQHQKNMQKLSAKGVREALEILQTEQTQEESQLAEKHRNGLLTEGAYQEELLKLRKKYLNQMLAVPGLSQEQTENFNQGIAKNETDTANSKTDERKKTLDKYGLTPPKSVMEQAYLEIADFEARGVLTHEEALKAKAKIDQEYLEALTGEVSKANQKIQDITGNLSSAISSFQEAETMSVTRKYDEQIKAAGKNEKKVKKLEEEKEKELAKIKAKYADKQFIVTIASVISSTALAAMQSYSAMAGIPVVGPALGAVAAAAAIAAGAGQIAVAKEQRDNAKAGYDTGGFTPSGPWDKPQGVVHSDEFIANRFATNNSLLRPVFDVVDYAQRNNTLSSLKKEDIVRALGIKGFASGGYVNSTIVTNNTKEIDSAYMESLISVIDRLDRKLNEPFYTVNSVTGRNGIKQAFDTYNKIKENKSRK